MKVIILANRQKWKSWESKTQQVKDWFHPVLDIEFTVEHVKLSKIPFESYGVFDGKERAGVSKSWYRENIVEKYPGYDRYILSMNRKDWKGFPVEGWQWDGNSITVASDEKGEYNFKGVKYDGGKWFNLARHELCHAEYTSRAIPDRTHEHWDSGDLSRVLIDFVKPSMKEATLTRKTDNGIETIGEISFGGKKFYSLERPWKNNASNISCIPKGDYTVAWTFSPKLMKYTYEITNVPGRSGIRIHSANLYTQILGCIALGTALSDINGDGWSDVINSKVAVGELETFFDKKPFKLSIV